MSKSWIEFLRHILDESKFVIDNTKDIDYDSFCEDEILKRAVVRSIEIIGEATKKIDEETREKYSTIEWKLMAKTRDKLIHHYFGVDYEIVWNIIEHKLPELIYQIEEILKKEK